jgi:hypothetical protein
MTERVSREGKIVKKRVAQGSKSERDAIILESPEREMVLRRMGANPFHDETLESLVGKTIRAHGFESGSSLIMTNFEELAD